MLVCATTIRNAYIQGSTQRTDRNLDSLHPIAVLVICCARSVSCMSNPVKIVQGSSQQTNPDLDNLDPLPVVMLFCAGSVIDTSLKNLQDSNHLAYHDVDHLHPIAAVMICCAGSVHDSEMLCFCFSSTHRVFISPCWMTAHLHQPRSLILVCIP